MMKWKFGSPGSLMLVYYYIKLSGLAPFTVRDSRFNPPTFPGKLYPLPFVVSYLVFMSLTFTRRAEMFYTTNFSLFFKIWATILHLIGIPIILVTLVTFLMMHKKIICIMNNLGTISHNLENLGIELDRGKFFGILLVTTMTANAALVISWILLYPMEPHIDIDSAIKYCIDSWFTTNTILIFTLLQIGITKCFTLLNEALYELGTPASHRPRSNHSGISIDVVSENERDNRPESVDLCADYQRLRIIEALHMELSDLLLRIAHLFATPILLNGVGFSALLVLYLYWMYYEFLDSTAFNVLSILCCVLKMVVASIQLFVIAHASVTTCQQGNATKAVLFKTWNKYTPAEPVDEDVNRMFSRFSQQLRHTTVAVSAFGIADLDYSFIHTIFGTVISYLIIVIQFDSLQTSS